jgi:hypothetical protein
MQEVGGPASAVTQSLTSTPVAPARGKWARADSDKIVVKSMMDDSSTGLSPLRIDEVLVEEGDADDEDEFGAEGRRKWERLRQSGVRTLLLIFILHSLW